MTVSKNSGSFLSSDGATRIYYDLYTPDAAPRAVVQISHGMCEYIGRYEAFAKFLASKGFVVCGNDHLGHGRSAQSPDDLGYYPDLEGWRHMTDDLYKMTRLIRDQLPGLPVFLLGHSMGSFLARHYLALYGRELDGAILSGTSGANPLNDMGLALARVIRKVKGPRYRSPMLQNMAFGKYNDRYEHKRTPCDWLTTDETVVDRYLADPWCSYTFTANGFCNLFALLKAVTGETWAAKLPKELPVYLMSGGMDPVGGYGNGVVQVAELLKKTGVSDVRCKLYEGGRHEMLNEKIAPQVYDDVLAWIEGHLPQPPSSETV